MRSRKVGEDTEHGDSALLLDLRCILRHQRRIAVIEVGEDDTADAQPLVARHGNGQGAVVDRSESGFAHDDQLGIECAKHICDRVHLIQRNEQATHTFEHQQVGVLLTT